MWSISSNLQVENLYMGRLKLKLSTDLGSPVSDVEKLELLQHYTAAWLIKTQHFWHLLLSEFLQIWHQDNVSKEKIRKD